MKSAPEKWDCKQVPKAMVHVGRARWNLLQDPYSVEELLFYGIYWNPYIEFMVKSDSLIFLSALPECNVYAMFIKFLCYG